MTDAAPQSIQPKGETLRHTPTPWYVRDFRETEMRRLGWTGPSLDRILITTEVVGGVEPNGGAVIARIQFDNRTELLGENNLADAQLIVTAVNSHAALSSRVEELEAALRVIESRDRMWTAGEYAKGNEVLDRAVSGSVFIRGPYGAIANLALTSHPETNRG